jgi:hypothetical protein
MLFATTAATAAEPTKEQAVRHLQSFVAALEANDLNKAIAHVAIAPGTTPEETKKTVGRLLALQEISRPGIDILASQGKWGKLSQLKAEKGPAWAQKYNVPVEQCYVLAHQEGAEAAFHFDGTALKIIRCDDIGKLKK